MVPAKSRGGFGCHAWTSESFTLTSKGREREKANKQDATVYPFGFIRVTFVYTFRQSYSSTYIGNRSTAVGGALIIG